MKFKYFVFESVSYALKAMSALKSVGVYARLEKIKNISALGGCGYALAVYEKDANTALAIANVNKILVLSVSDEI